MKQLKDSLHFYLGCDLKTDTGVVTLIAVQKEVIPCTDYRVICLNGNVTHELKGEFKPILRPLSDMTEEEFIELFKKCSLFDLSECVFEFSESYEVWINAVHNGVVIDGIQIVSGDCVMMMNNDGGYSPINPQSECMAWFLSKHFDLFDLIESGLAIDKTTYNTQQV